MICSHHRRWVPVADFHREPFRVFFPAATLAGFLGVGLWPVMLLGWTENFPGPSHARLMVQGFFGGFIFGFLGTAMPRLVGAAPFSAVEAFTLLVFFVGNVTANALGRNLVGDGLFLCELALLVGLLLRRCFSWLDLPPPSFVLVGLSFASAWVGTGLHLIGQRWELSEGVTMLARLLSYHGFVLLCILGAGGFLLPRFFGLGGRREFLESRVATPEWKRAFGIACAAGMLILATFAVEAAGGDRVAATGRAGVLTAYLFYAMPLERLRWHWRGVHWQLLCGLVCIPLGVLAAGWFSPMRLAWAHLELLGGFALVTTSVATRVVFGHSGERERLERFQPWLTVAAVLMLAGLTSRISGDFLPGIQRTHYLYGAACWMAGLVLWSVSVLPLVLRSDPEV